HDFNPNYKIIFDVNSKDSSEEENMFMDPIKKIKLPLRGCIGVVVWWQNSGPLQRSEPTEHTIFSTNSLRRHTTVQ
ncbi:20607_t:CDS:2, partial [Racocetra persica]